MLARMSCSIKLAGWYCELVDWRVPYYFDFGYFTMVV